MIAARTDPDDIILDIACGNGSILRDLKARGYRNLHGLEISRYAVRRLAEEGIVMHYGSIPILPLRRPILRRGDRIASARARHPA